MRTGIVPVENPHFGGVYQYSATMLETLRQWTAEGCDDEFVVFSAGLPQGAERISVNEKWTVRSSWEDESVSWKRHTLEFLRTTIGEGPHRDALRRLLGRPVGKEQLEADLDKRNRREFVSNQLRCEGVDLMLFPAPLTVAFETDIPYVMAIHDLQHRLQPEFPEVSAGGEWERREHLFRNGARYATLLLADSEVGKEDILNFYSRYGVTSDQVKVLPFLPACYLSPEISQEERNRVRSTHHLPERYLFYPAQFWPHKNHKRIVQALALLHDRGVKVDVVFCGSYGGKIRSHAFKEVMTIASQAGIKGNIHYRGYVSDHDMSGLYAEAAGLVMPTFFGPTNIPVLEAWALGCPVLTSDIRGIREQVKDAGLLVDPRSVEAIADGMSRLWTDECLAKDLARRGRARLTTYTPEDYRSRLIAIMEEGKMRRFGVQAKVGAH
jgi:glycosyltransferase involved in cell wall biosynthesis